MPRSKSYSSSKGNKCLVSSVGPSSPPPLVQLHEQLLEQEKQMLQNRLSWLGEESQRSTSQLNAMRQERAEEVGVLQSRQTVVEEELKTATASITRLKEEKAEVERKMEDVLKQLREVSVM